MTTAVSGYHDPMRVATTMRRGAWTLDVGTLPDGRWSIDYFNAYNGARTRHYFDSESEATAEARRFVGWTGGSR